MFRRHSGSIGLLCGLTVAFAGCGGSSSSSSTARQPTPTAPTPAFAVASTFGSAADLAACLGSSQTGACFSAARVTAVVAAATAPGAPINLTATVVGSTVTLVWMASPSMDPVTTYVLEAGSSAGAANLANFATGGAATSFVAPGVGAGTYFVRVRSQNASGTSAASNEVVITVGGGACVSAPNAPGGLAGTASGSTVTLTWSAPASGCPVTAYVLEAGSSAGQSNLANSSTGSSSTSYVASGVGAGTYYVRVRAQNANGQSGTSNEIIVTVGAAPTTIDVQPRDTIMGTMGGCVGGNLGVRFTVTAPPDVSWSLKWTGSDVGGTPFLGIGADVDRTSGTGSGTVTFMVTLKPQTPIPGFGSCSSVNNYSYGDHFYFTFRDSRGGLRAVIVTNASWIYQQLR